MSPYALIAAANVVGGSTYPATTVALRGFAEKDLLFLRMVVCMIPFLPFLWSARARLGAWSRGDWGRVAAVGLFGYALPLSLGTYGLKLSSATSASLLVGMEPVAIVLLSALFLGERMTRLKVLSLFLGLSGATLIAFQGFPNFAGAFTDRLKGDLILAGHGACWALYSVIGKSAMRRVRPLDFTAATTAFGVLGVSLWAGPSVVPSSWEAASFGAWAALFYLALAGGFLATWMWNAALEKVDAGKVANFIFLQPLVGVLFGVLLQSDSFTGWSAAGGALVLSGMWAATRS